MPINIVTAAGGSRIQKALFEWLPPYGAALGVPLYPPQKCSINSSVPFDRYLSQVNLLK